MTIRIIEKIYHHTNSPILSTLYRTDRELFWIKELGTGMPYDCSDNIKGVGNLSSPECSEINVMSLFNAIPRTKRSHGHKRRNMEEFSVVFMKRFRSNWFEKTKGRHVTYNTRQSVLRRKRIYASFVKSKIPKIFEVAYR
jgi:hypothetical protein